MDNVSPELEIVWKLDKLDQDQVNSAKGKGGKYLEKENIFFVEEKKRRKYLEKEIIFCGGEGKGRNYLDKEN